MLISRANFQRGTAIARDNSRFNFGRGEFMRSLLQDSAPAWLAEPPVNSCGVLLRINRCFVAGSGKVSAIIKILPSSRSAARITVRMRYAQACFTSWYILTL